MHMPSNNSLKELQQKVDDWIKSHGGYWPPLAMLSAIMEEVGEVAREVNYYEGFKPKKNKEKQVNLGEELADLLFSLICVANYYKINLSNEFDRALTKYLERDSTRFL